MTENARILIFSSGSQDVTWVARNCDRCQKAASLDGENSQCCELDQALLEACFDDGTIDSELAARMGYKEGAYTWDCAEIEVRA